MATGIEGQGLKIVVDFLLAIFHKAVNMRIEAKGKAAINEAIRELLMAPSNLRSAEAKILIAKAAGIISAELLLAEEMLSKHKMPAKKAISASRFKLKTVGRTKVSAKKPVVAPRKKNETSGKSMVTTIVANKTKVKKAGK